MSEMFGDGWEKFAVCKNADPEAFFVMGAEQNAVKKVCKPCPVRYDCLAEALDNRIEFGVWGGMTERERRKLLRGSFGVESWQKTFMAQLALEKAQRDVS